MSNVFLSRFDTSLYFPCPSRLLHRYWAKSWWRKRPSDIEAMLKYLRKWIARINYIVYITKNSTNQNKAVGLDSLQWRYYERDGVSNHQRHDCLLNRLFRRRSKKTSKLRVTGLCAGNSPMTGEFPAQMASNAVNVSIWWRHNGYSLGQNISILKFQHVLFKQ